MPTDFKLPALGENVDSGTVVSVLVKKGDPVKKDQPVLEVETEKAVLDVPCAVEGTVAELLVKVGDKVTPGQAVLRLDGSGAPAAKSAAPAKTAEPPKAAKAPEPSRPAAPPPPAPAAPAAPVPAAPASQAAPSGPAAPSVRKFAREIGVDVAEVRGSGPGGRISIEDVKAHARGRGAGPAPAGAAAAPPLPDFGKWGEVERRRLGGVREATARHMALSWGTIPMVTQHDRADISELEELRREHAKSGADFKLTVTAVALKIAAAALKKFPQFNASLDAARGELVLKKYVHIGVAVDTPHGLLVPVLRDVDAKSLSALAKELQELAVRARDRKLSLEEMQGGCFTITNLGGIGGTQFTPIVNWPEAAILGLSRSSVEPVFLNGAFAPRTILPLSLTYDHRIVDGADAARFLRWVAQAFQHPLMLEL